MRIILVVPEFPPDSVGGGGEVAAALMAEFAKTDDVCTIAGRPGVCSINEIDNRGIIRIDEFPFPRKHSFLASAMPPTPRGLYNLHRSLRDADVVHIHGYGFPVVDFAAALARARKIPYLFTLHGYPVTPARRGGWLAAGFAGYRALLGDHTLRGAAAWSAVSHSVATFYRREYGIEMTVVPNGVAALPAVTRVRNGNEFRIFCVGRLEWIKDFATVIRALARTAGDVILRIAGRDNGAHAELAALAGSLGVSSRVTFLGYLERNALAQEYADADVCVVASVTEAFPAVPLEAMRSGVALITTPVGGVLEYGRDRENLLYFPVGDEVALADRIALIRESSTLRETIIRGGLQTASGYSWSSVARTYRHMLVSVVRGNQN